MQLKFKDYKDKLMGGWAGKNIGGVLGAPFECQRQFNEIDFFTQNLENGPPPNDDLDLQIVWLSAVEKHGRAVNAAVLGEYWLSYVIPHWAEYGTGKANLRAGLTPPLSGSVNNQYGNSCGCFIRSEIWAALAPGHPEIAVRYAYEDGIVDHSQEGVYGEVFCAALESAAYVEGDTRKLIDIGLSYIPTDSAVARCVKKAVCCYDNKVDIREARIMIHNEAPGVFGGLGRRISEIPTEGGKMAIGTPGFDCPENIGFLIAGWLYGEGDFGKSLCLAVACGEDTDCTAATLGAILGITMGASNLPEKWTAPLDDKIATMCINTTSWGRIFVPQTVTELTDRVLRATPLFLGIEYCDILAGGGYVITCAEGNGLYCPEDDFLPHHISGYFPRGFSVRELVGLSQFAVRHEFTTHTVVVDYGKEPFFRNGELFKLRVCVINNDLMYEPMWCKIRAYAPENVYLTNGEEFIMQINTLYGDKGETVFCIDPSEFTGGKIEVIIDVSIQGRHTSTPVKATLLRKA